MYGTYLIRIALKSKESIIVHIPNTITQTRLLRFTELTVSKEVSEGALAIPGLTAEGSYPLMTHHLQTHVRHTTRQVHQLWEQLLQPLLLKH